MLHMEPGQKERLMDKNVLIIGDNFNSVKRCIKDYITELSNKNHKIFLLDSFWTKETYKRFLQSRYRKEIERRYHIKLSVDDLLKTENVFEYMNNKEINIMKVKSIVGFMSAAELFPVVLSKINEDLRDEKVHIFLNDFVLEHLDGKEFADLYKDINHEQIKFIIINKRIDIVKPLLKTIDEIIRLN